MSWQLHEFSDDKALIERLAARIGSVLTLAVKNRGHASIAVSGGSTPIALYRRLSTMTLPWQNIIVSLVDERWVDHDHVDSNAALVASNLLQNAAAAARFVGMKTSAGDPLAAQQALSVTLAARILPLDIALLGMGEDGHIASLFPHANGTRQALSLDDPLLCRGIELAGAPYGRMTLTAPGLLAASYRFLYVTGHTKYDVLRAASTPGPAIELPVRAVLHGDVHTDVYYAPK